jgi:hypothetical protein
MNVTRRNVLQLLGLASAAYAASSVLGEKPVRAGNAAIPKRIVFFYTEHGTLKQFKDDGTLEPFWAPDAPGAPDPLTIQKPWSTNNFTLRDIHQPLVKHQNRILMLDGLDMVSSNVDPTGPANSHINGNTHALIANNRQSASVGGGISIDQYIAKALNSPSPVTVLPSLEVMVDGWGGSGGVESSPLYLDAGQPLPISGDAPSVYDRMFPNGPQGQTAAEKAKQQKLLDQQKAVVDAAYARFKTSSGRVSTIDRARLDAHAQALLDLKARLDLSNSSSCMAPDKSVTAGALNAGDSASYEANADILAHLVTTALACDLTRVATYYMMEPPQDLFNYQSVGGTTNLHDMIHKTNGASAPLANDPTAIGIMKSYQQYHAQRFADFLDMLDAIPEPDGTTLLDNTLVVWCGQLAGGDHSLDRIPYILAGNLQGTVKTGRYVRYPRVKDGQAWPAYSVGPAHNDLFVTLANLLGVSTNTFGNPAVCKGPLSLG